MKPRILVADDETDVCEMIKEYLDERGYEVNIAVDGKTAVHLIEKNPSYAVAILDENMPGLTGLEVVKYIKVKKLPIKTVLLTAYPEVNEWFSKKVGTDIYLQKPVDLEKIEKVVRILLEP